MTKLDISAYTNKLPAALKENSSFLGAAFLAYVGSRYGNETAQLVGEVFAGILSLIAIVTSETSNQTTE